MQVFENTEETGTTVVIDNTTFVNCKYTNCTLIYSGEDYAWSETLFLNCKVELQGAAHRTAALMGLLGIQPPAATSR